MIKAIIFDFFGVICSDEYWSFVHADRQQDSVYRDYADDVNLGRVHWQEFVRKLADITGNTIADVKKMYQAEKLNPDVIDFIVSLKKDYKIGLLTNAHHEFIDTMLETTHLDQLFDSVVVSSRVGVVKPDQRIFNLAIDELKIKPCEAVFIDDVASYCAAAEQIGLRAITYESFAQTKHDLTQILADKTS